MSASDTKTCECGHAWSQHTRTTNGACACKYFGCGCSNVVPPYERPPRFKDRTMELARDLEARAKDLEAERYGHLTPDEVQHTRPCVLANLHRNFADKLRLLAGRMPI